MVLTVVRYAVFSLVALCALGAIAAMAIQRRALNPFGRPARTIREMTDPFIKPIERVLLRRGGNPQNAPWWLLGGAIVGGIVIVSTAQWLQGTARSFAYAAQGGPRMTVATIVSWTISLLKIALLIRVIGSWFGQDRFSKWMRPFVFLTEWMLAPLRRIIPPFGPMDLTPLVAWFLLSLLGPWLVRMIV